MKKTLIILFAVIVSFVASAQESPQDSLVHNQLLSLYGKYFETPPEGIYAHFNKGGYMTGEGVWFKIYLLETGKKRPFDVPQNVYAELFDPSGKVVDRQVLYAGKGSAQGMIELADSLPSGTYTFRAYTNWMRNFSQDRFYTRTFSVSGGISGASRGAGDSAPAGDSDAFGAGQASAGSGLASAGDYDIQFFPEGGHLLAGIVNNVGFKILDRSGKGQALSGILRNAGGDTLLRLTTGKLGMGSLPLEAVSGESYYADFFLSGDDGKVQTVSLPPVEEQGITLNAQWFYPAKVSLLLRTNRRSLPLLNGKKFYLLVHNRGNVAQFLVINWKDKPFLKLDIDKSYLLNGINHVTLFDEQYQPLADRMIFNKRKEQLGSLSVETSLENDSLTWSLLAENSGRDPLQADMSISFLPAGTLAGNFNTSIYSALLLESDLRGTIEYPAWYFEEDSFERMKALDNLLLSQGWRRYDWAAIRKGSPPPPVHVFEQGFTISGKVLNSISRKEMEKSQVSVFSPENGLITAVEVDSSGAFELPNVFLLDSSRVIINATNAKGRSGFRDLEASVSKPRYEKEPPLVPAEKEASGKETASFVLPEGSELLQTVTVTQKAISPEEAAFKNSIYSSMNDRVVVITKDNYFRYNSVRDLLLKEFNIMRNSMGRGGGSFTLIVDDMPMNDLDWLDAMNVNDVEAVSVNKSGSSMLGSRGAGGYVHIKTRTQGVDWGERASLNIENLIVEGFSAPVAYYAPKYSVTAGSPLYRERAAVYWNPAVQTDSAGKALFKFAVPPGIDSLKVRTEGISPTGIVIFDERIIGVK